MRFIADALGIDLPGGGYSGPTLRNPGKGVYKSPSGNKIPFDYGDVESSIDTKAAVFENAAGDGTYVQPNKHTSLRAPITAIFHGDGFEKKGDAFVGALLEDGVGVLTHPDYTVPINVVPVGEIRRRHAFVSGDNQLLITVQFFETTGLLIGSVDALPQLFDSFIDASAVDFSDKTLLDDAADRQSFLNKVSNVAKNIQMVMTIASQGLSGATQRIDDAGASIDRGLDMLVGQPLALARQTQLLIGEPRRQNDGVKSKQDGYKNLAASIFLGIAEEPSKYSNDRVNNFQMDKMAVQAIVANSAMLATEGSGEYITKADYILAAEALEQLLYDYQAWSDDNYTNLASTAISQGATDTGGGMMELNDIVGYALSDLITKSFSAKTEMSMELAGDQTPIDLCYDLYGTTEFETMDLFLYTNKIQGDEHFLIPKGREIVWYV